MTVNEIKRFCYWKPGGETGEVIATSTFDAAKKILGVEQPGLCSATSVGCTYMAEPANNICKVWEIPEGE